MTKAEALARLRAREADLRAMGIERLSIFGSTARGEERSDSDVDLAVRLAHNLRIGAFGFVRMEDRIAELLGHKVDLVTEPFEEAPRLQAQIDRDRVPVF